MANEKKVNDISLDDLGDRERLRLPALRLNYRPVEERVEDFDEACQLSCPLNNNIRGAMR